VVWYGVVESETSVNLNFLSAGKLVYVGAQKGDRVTKGQTIASLDQRSTQRNIQQAVRDYAKQRNAFDATKESNQNHTPEDALNATMRRLLENNQNDLEKTVTSVELQQLALEQSVLTSPIDGVLVRVDAPVPGVNIGATTIFTVADPENLVFKTDVDEADIGKITLDQIMKISFDAFPDQEITVPVTFVDIINHKTDTGANVYSVEAKLPLNTDYHYRIGMSGDAEIILSQHHNALTAPLSSLVDDTYVYVQTEKGFEKRKIRVGIEGDTDFEVLSGLQEGEKVALQPEEAEKLVENKK
jgi:RND family efflux transporter MFP subunit